MVGASYVALECAGFLTELGIPTTLMARSIFLRGYDQEMANKLGTYMENHGTKMYKETSPISISKSSLNKILVKYKEKNNPAESTEEFDTVLLAIGRKASTQSLHLENLGIATQPNGTIVVNEKEQTVVPNIFAVGDAINGRPQLAPVAIRAGKLLARRLVGVSEELMDYRFIPSTVFTPLEYGFCGFSEDEALSKFGKKNMLVYRSVFKPVEWNFLSTREEDACYTKLVVDKHTGKILGLHYLGPNAGDVVQGFAVAIKLGITKTQWDQTVGIHPTCAEVILGQKGC